MIKFNKIESSHNPLLKEYYALYETAFPPEERRGKKDFEALLGEESQFYPYLLFDDETFIGFFNYWMIDDFCFGEHFAILPELRGRQYGSRVMKQLLAIIGDLPLVFEVEKPDSTDAKRRISFYEQFDMYPLKQEYAQPLYGNPKELLPLLLMSNKLDFANKNFARIKKSIYAKIYGIV